MSRIVEEAASLASAMLYEAAQAAVRSGDLAAAQCHMLALASHWRSMGRHEEAEAVEQIARRCGDVVTS